MVDKGFEIYEGRLSGKTWTEVAWDAELPLNDALKAAKVYAETNHREWPPIGATLGWDGNPRNIRAAYGAVHDLVALLMPMSNEQRSAAKSSKLLALGKQAYELKVKGMTWYDIAHRLFEDISDHGKAADAARKYALVNDLPWPLVRNREEDQERQKQSYLRRAEGETWFEIAIALGYNGEQPPHFGAKTFAIRETLPWPIPPIDFASLPEPETPLRDALAYRCREQGIPWVTVTRLCGLMDVEAARAAALAHAISQSKPWPIGSDPETPA